LHDHFIVFPQDIDDEVGEARHDQFSSADHSSFPSALGKHSQPLDRLPDRESDSVRLPWALLAGDVRMKTFDVS